MTAFVYNPDATRNRDMSCYPPTHRFLADELLPLLRERFRAARSPARTILADEAAARSPPPAPPIPCPAR